jgi:putative restriction endonuclease
MADLDTRLRLAAVEQLKRVAIAGVVSSEDLRAGFFVDGKRVPYINPQRGIFKPESMRYALSVRTVFPVSGRRVWYDDQQRVYQQIQMGDDLRAARNVVGIIIGIISEKLIIAYYAASSNG